MQIKPPVAIATVAALLVLLFGGYLLYERSSGGATGKRPPISKEMYQGPRADGTPP